jgi:hypothetical protein
MSYIAVFYLVSKYFEILLLRISNLMLLWPEYKVCIISILYLMTAINIYVGECPMGV